MKPPPLISFEGMRPAMSREDLDYISAQWQRLYPEATSFGMGSLCHPEGGVDLRYKGGGVLEVRCHECRRPAGAFELASRPLPRGDA